MEVQVAKNFEGVSMQAINFIVVTLIEKTVVVEAIT